MEERNENRRQEWNEYLGESEQYSSQLDQIDRRLHMKMKHHRRNQRIKGVSGFLMLFCVFVVLVNTNKAMANALLHLPVIGELVELVRFDQGLSNAIKNKYAQKVDLIERDGEYTLGIPYVISDENRLVVFYQVPESIYSETGDVIHFYITKVINEDTMEEYSGYCVDFPNIFIREGDEKRTMCYSNLRSPDSVIPRNLILEVEMEKEDCSERSSEPVRTSTEQLFEPTPDTTKTLLGRFQFHLHLNEPKVPRVHNIEQKVDVMEQQLWIHTVTEYPTGTEVVVEYPQNSEERVLGIDLELLDQKGHKYGRPGGVIASGPDEDGKIKFYFEGDYFSDAELDHFAITGITMIKKSEEMITINLKNQTMTPRSEDLGIEKIERTGDKAYITMVSKQEYSYQVVDSRYTDSENHEYYFTSQSFTTDEDLGKCTSYFAVVWPKDDLVIMRRTSAPKIELEIPVEIPIP